LLRGSGPAASQICRIEKRFVLGGFTQGLSCRMSLGKRFVVPSE
jgi:hypothetical protein